MDPAAARTAARATSTPPTPPTPPALTATVTVAAPTGSGSRSPLTAPTVLLGLVGIDTVTVHGSADAVLVPTAGATP